MSSLPVVFMAFANDSENPLFYLSREEEAIKNSLRGRAKNSHFLLEIHSIAKKESVADAITDHWQEMELFHFSGHANPEELAFSDGTGKKEGLSGLLELNHNLKLVFLNACSTYGHVDAYLKGGIPVVIATSAKVDDRVAANFSDFFYKALCIEGFSVGQAFQRAKSRIAFKYDKYDIELYKCSSLTGESQGRDLVLEVNELGNFYDLIEKGEEFKWGLYYKNEEALNWSLPYQAISHISLEERINLTEDMIETFAPYNSEIRYLQAQEGEGEIINPGQYRDSIIKCLPAPLGVQMRKVFSRLPNDLSQVTQDHIVHIVNTYSTLMELVAFSMLAQLWEALTREQKETSVSKPLKINEQYSLKLKNFFNLDEQDRKQYNFVDLIRTVREIFDNNEINYFVGELEGLKDVINKDIEFEDGREFMESLRWKLAKDHLPPQSIPNIYIQAEKHLSNFLKKLGFCAKYRLIAIKNINLIQARHQIKPIYNHNLVPLIACGTYDADQHPYMGYTHSRSVIMLKSMKDINEFLTLTPFIIDKNAYDDKSKKSSIYFFTHYDKQKDSYIFQDATRHIG